MTDYKLDINIDSQGLHTIQAAGQVVTLVKSVGGGGNMPVAWLSFHPMQSNTLTWTNQYSVYASSTKIQANARIVSQSTQLATGGSTYTFSGGQFDYGKSNGLTIVQYGVENQDADFLVDGMAMITSGLYQGAVVNGGAKSSPLNAVEVPYNESGTFTPKEVVQVFVSNYQDNGMVISSVTSKSLTVDLTSSPSQTIHYDDHSNQFVGG